MTAAKMETAAEKYRRIKAERLAGEELHDFTSPSGMTWKLRRPVVANFVRSGVMPMSLAQRLKDSFESSDSPEAAFSALDLKDQIRTVEFQAKVVKHCAVEPRIVENPSAPDEIGYDEVEMDDFDAIFKWAMPGGEEADDLATFRGK